MDHINSFLLDWCIRFLQNRDSIRKEIISIEKTRQNAFTINYKDKVKYFFIAAILNNDVFNNLNMDSFTGIFTLNNPSNIRFIVTEWKKMIESKFLSIFFINPLSSAEKVWAIGPYIHDKVCDKSSLELGLKSMAEMVTPLGIEELNNKIRLLKEEPAL